MRWPVVMPSVGLINPIRLNAAATGWLGSVTLGASSGRPAAVTAVPYAIFARLAMFCGVLMNKSATPAIAL
jgi:hypothetical protein